MSTSSTLLRSIALGGALLFGMGTFVPSTATAAAVVSPDVYQKISSGSGGTVFVYLNTKADLSRASLLSDKRARGRFVVDTLRKTADTTQAGLRTELARRGVAYQSYFVINALQVPADKALVDWLATRPEVARIDYNHQFLMLDTPVEERELVNETAGVEWNITAIKAPTVWAMGYKGQGIVVAGNDTGVDWTHPTIIKQYRGYVSSTTANHAYNWFDGTTRNRTDAYDDHGHGTFTVGEMVGDDGQGNQIGAAPSAQWIACKNMNSSGIGTVESYTKCFQWFIAPTDSTGANPNPDKAPDIVNNSWGCPTSEGCNKDTLHDIVNTVQSAGIMLIFSAGNSGPSCSTVMDPPATYPEVMSVGATDSSSNIASFSSRGPSTFDRGAKPNISAPGQGVRSCMPKGGYSSMSGTSMAAPLVVGATALMWSAKPSLIGKISDTAGVLTKTATAKRAPKCGGDSTTGSNNIFGFGIVNAKAAVDSALTLP